MTLSCECDYADYDNYVIPDDFFSKLEASRRKRCRSCGELIDIGADVLMFRCYRQPNCDYEDNRYPDGVPLSDKYLCSSCAEIWLNLSAAGYCLELGSDLREDMREYWRETGFTPQNEG